MKRSGKRLLAMLLCLTMVLTLLPMTALAARNDEQPETPAEAVSGAAKGAAGEIAEEAPEDFDAADLAETIYPDGAVADTWKQDENTVRGTGSVCAVEEGRLHLKGTATNTNNGGTNANPPAMFINETMNAALAASEEEEKTLSFDVEPVAASVSGNPLFGLYLNYKSESGAVWGKAICVDTSGKHWFWQSYYAGADSWGDIVSNNTAFDVAGKNHIELKWKDTAITSFKVNDTVLVSSEITMEPIVNAIGQQDAVGFKVGSHSGSDSVGDFYISNLHYTGQEPMASLTVSGTVKDSANKAIEGAAVAAGDFTATTDAQGRYTLTVTEGTYTITATKEGYYEASLEDVAVTENLTGKNFTLRAMPKVTGTVTDKATGKAIAAAAVTLSGRDAAVATDANGRFEVIGVAAGNYTLTVTAEGYDAVTTEQFTVADADVTQNVALSVHTMDVDTIATDTMTVTVNKKFPQVVQYQVGETVVRGQAEELNTLKLNGVNVVPTVAYEKVGDKTAKYTMTVNADNNATTNLNVVITARLVVGDDGDNTLAFYIDHVEYAGADEAAKKAERLAHPLETIEVPNHSLVSVRDTEAGETNAQFSGGKMSGDTRTRGDSHFTASKNIGFNNGLWVGDYLIGFVSDKTMSAGMASNSEYGTDRTGGSANYPVRCTLETKGGGTVADIALSSTLWYYDRKTTSVNPGVWENYYLTEEQKVQEPTELPLFAKISITTKDENDDGKMNWQDGAIYYRDTVMHKPDNSEGDGIVGIRDAVNFRINLNFGSQAQNPFLVSLDNVKRVAASTDGLGQLILMKGYAGEGHDSNHPDYWDIGQRMGGVADFNTMLEEGKKYGAQFGIHVNASEYYPESEASAEARMGREGSTLDNQGNLVPGGLRYGWNWIDQGINMNVLYDMATGDRAERFKRLYDLVGNNLTFVYVDVWGNNQHGVGEDGWMTRRLTKEITSVVGSDGTKSNWRIAHEWSYANPYNATFQHWTSDYTYGNYSYKGQSNSDIMRFCLNSYRDSFPADFATFGGACNAPLLGGPSMQGFEGWQKDDEYDLNIENTFNQMVYTKFLQHFDIMEWINAENTVTVPFSVGANGAHNMSSTSEWAPEMQIVLKSPDRKHTVVVTRGTRTDGVIEQPVFDTLDDEVKYRSRVVTLDGRIIVEGAPKSAGEDEAFPRSKATLKYLIPWNWDAYGNEVTSDQEKMYHWNAQGGTSRWELPEDWKTLDSVILYKLTDQGRSEGREVAVLNGTITLTRIEANTGYVVVKGEESKGPSITYGTGLHVEDPSFNVDIDKGPWTVTGGGSASRVRNPGGISAVGLIGDVALSQEMTDLTNGGKYVTYVGVDNLDGKASITVTDKDGNEVASNYTMESIAINYISGYGLHTQAGLATTGGFRTGKESRFQNMYIFYTYDEAKAPYTLTLKHEGANAAYFDDVITKTTTAENITRDGEGNITAFTQDFEDVAQGMYPFVVAGIEGVEDNRQHLSELNAPFTQAGWDVKHLDDVIDGEWSIKVNGLTQRSTLVMQTIPQNFRFEPNKSYTVEFDYEMGSTDIYWACIGEGKWEGMDGIKWVRLEKTLDVNRDYAAQNTTAKAAVGHAKFSVVGAESGQTWIGIFSSNTVPEFHGATDSAQNFGGYKEIVIDNLSITLDAVNKVELSNLVDTANEMDEASYTKADSYEGTEEAAWTAFTTARTAAETALNNTEATQDEVDAAKTALETAIANLKKVIVVLRGTVIGVNNAPVAGATVTLENASYMPVGLTATTDDEGAFEFRSTEDVDLTVASYKVKVQATGYLVNTFDVTAITKTDPESETTCALVSEAPGAYVNDFNDGDVSMMGYLSPVGTAGVPTWSAEEFNGSKALKINFHSSDRGINNVVDKTVKIKNGTVSFDITGLTNGLRIGLTMRATDPNTRIFVGQENTYGKWFWEWWNGSNNTSWGGTVTDQIALNAGVTRRVRIELADENVKVFIDGVQIYNADMEGAPTEAGWIGINMREFNEGYDYYLDNLRIVSTDALADGTYTVSGNVTTGDDAVVLGAAVSILDSEGTLITGTTTNAAGQYTTLPIEPGTYTIRVSAPDYTTVEQELVVGEENIPGKNFELVVDTARLQNLYDEYKDLTNDDETYSAESFAALTAALTEAETTLAKTDLTAAEIAAGYEALKAAVDGLEEKAPDPTDFSGLRDKYNEARAISNIGYLVSTWEALQEALTNANAVLANVNATQEEVDAAKKAIEDAVDGLSTDVAEDLTALREAFEAAKDLVQDDYSSGWAAFETAREAAQTILSDPTAYTQAQVDTATTALKNAQSALRKKGTGGNGGGTVVPPADQTETVTNPDGSTTTTVTKPDGTITETTVATDGATVEKVTDPEKNVEITVTDKDGEEVAKVEIPAAIPVPETRFEDVPEGHWADEGIHNMAALKAVNGVGNNQFDMNSGMTRGDLATILHRLSNKPAGGEVSFEDVDNGKYYAEGVAWAAKTGVVTGFSKDTYKPEQIITREQMALMLMRYAKLLGMDTTADAAELDVFADGANTHDWAVEGVAWCVANGILQGKGGSTLDPTSNVTRAQVAVMLDRFVALMK